MPTVLSRRLRLYPSIFFFNDTATTEIYTLSLHDALPISLDHQDRVFALRRGHGVPGPVAAPRSEEHTSELQSHLNLVCRLLLEKKKKTRDLRTNCGLRRCAMLLRLLYVAGGSTGCREKYS